MTFMLYELCFCSQREINALYSDTLLRGTWLLLQDGGGLGRKRLFFLVPAPQILSRAEDDFTAQGRRVRPCLLGP